MKRYLFAVLAYLVPTFALGFVWHLVLFQSYYEALAIYRRDIIVPFGFLSMLIQAAIFAWLYEKAFADRHDRLPAQALAYGAVGAILSPMDSFFVLRGLKTLPLRMARHEASARRIAAFLDRHRKVVAVHYPGLRDHPQHALAKRQQGGPEAAAAPALAAPQPTAPAPAAPTPATATPAPAQ